MARWGVSVYLGGPEVAERLPGYLDAVAKHGGQEIFTSLHIPEVPLEAAVAQLEYLTGEARARSMAVVADIAPRVLAGMGVRPDDLSPLTRLGLAGLRLDYGFAPAEIAAFARNPQGVRIVLNTSTADPAFLAEVMAHGADPALLESCHNYYPRPETGLSLDSFVRTSRFFTDRGLRVAAFVPGAGERRGPIHAGLPTLERHREMEAGRAAAELLATGLVETVLIGDPWATEAELRRIGEMAGAGGVVLRVRLAPGLDVFQRGIVLDALHANRPDAAEFVLRSTASRGYAARGPAIAPFNTVSRPVGSVTIDNEGYLRYSGELQVALVDLPADPRVNVVAQVVPDDLPLLGLVGPGRAFVFRAVDG